MRIELSDEDAAMVQSLLLMRAQDLQKQLQAVGRSITALNEAARLESEQRKGLTNEKAVDSLRVAGA